MKMLFKRSDGFFIVYKPSERLCRCHFRAFVNYVSEHEFIFCFAFLVRFFFNFGVIDLLFLLSLRDMIWTKLNQYCETYLYVDLTILGPEFDLH